MTLYVFTIFIFSLYCSFQFLDPRKGPRIHASVLSQPINLNNYSFDKDDGRSENLRGASNNTRPLDGSYFASNLAKISGQLPPSAPWLPTALIEKSHRQIKTNINSCRSKKSALLIHSVQHTSNKTKVPNQSSDILKRPQDFLKESSIFLWRQILSNVKNSGRLFQIFVAFSEYLNFEDW